MASFLEKLKKGMGVEIPQDLEPEEEIQVVEEPEIKIEEEKKDQSKGLIKVWSRWKKSQRRKKEKKRLRN